MTKRTVKKKLKKLYSAWLKSLPKTLKKDVKSSTFVSGGAIVSLLTDDVVHDLDVYLTDKRVAESLVRHYLGEINCRDANDADVQETADGVKVFIRSSGIVEEGDASEDKITMFRTSKKESENYKPVVITDNAITLSGGVQIILRFVGSPETVHTNFDFEHCKCYYTPGKDELVLPKTSLLSIVTKELMYGGSKYPLCSIIRTRKFIQRGWSIHAGQYLKMIWQCGELDLNSISVLQDQLIGVDALYFISILRDLREAKAEGRQITSSYVAELVDKAFG